MYNCTSILCLLYYTGLYTMVVGYSISCYSSWECKSYLSSNSDDLIKFIDLPTLLRVPILVKYQILTT